MYALKYVLSMSKIKIPSVLPQICQRHEKAGSWKAALIFKIYVLWEKLNGHVDTS